MSAQYSQTTEKLDNLPLVLVVGGAGFLGANLCQALLSKNIRVYCLDNFLTGKKDNLKLLFNNKAFTFTETDINKAPFPENLKPDYIFHLAGVEEYINGVDVSLETLLVNSLGTKNVLDLTQKTGAKLLIVSSLSVYEGVMGSLSLAHDFGLSQKEMQKYTHHEAKRFSEAIATEYFKKYNLDIRVARIRDIFGPQMPLEEGSPLNKFFKESQTGDKITVEGDGLDILYPTYIDDAVEGLEKAMFAPQTQGKIYSLVSPVAVTVLNFAYALQKATPNKLKIEFVPAADSFKFPKKFLEIKKTQEDLNWNPKVSLEEGIKKTLESFSQEKLPSNLSPIAEITPSPEKIAEGVPLTPPQPVSVKTEIKPSFPPVSLAPPPPKEILLTKEPTKPVTLSPEARSLKEPIKKRKRIKFLTVVFSLFILLLFLGYPFLSFSLQTLLGIRNLESSFSEIEKGNFTASLSQSRRAQNYLQGAIDKVDSLTWLSTIIKTRKDEAALKDTLEIGENFSQVIGQASLAAKNLETIKEDLTIGFSPNTKDIIIETKTQIDSVDNKLAFIQAFTANKKISCPFKLPFCSKLENLTAKLPMARNFIAKSGKILESLPDIVGSDGRKNYLVLLENNAELRGSGGFIGSLALVTFENGKLAELKLEDIYSVDGALKGHVDPPDEVLHYLGQPNWYLRDSNVNPDFPLSAKRAAWFFEKERGIIPDGVISLDLSFVRLILESVGPVKLPGYQETITAQNFFSIAEKESEAGFFPGSTQKKDFLSLFLNALVNKLNSEKNPIGFSLLSKINQAVDEKHLQFYFADAKIQDVFESLNVTGEIKNPSCLPNDSCISDMAFFAENNFGANKANFFIKRKITRKIIIGRDGNITENIAITYKNESPSNSWPGGNYSNYIKFYAPLQSKLLTINQDNKKAVIDTTLTEDKIKKLQKDEFLVIEATEGAKTTWATLVNIPVKKEKTIEINYELPNKLLLKSKTPSLEIYQQKQAGLDNDPFDLSVEFPSFFKVSQISPQEKGIVANDSVISYNSDLSVDRKLNIIFKR